MLFYGKDIDLAPLLEQSQAVINATVKEMQNRVGRTADLRSIVLTGGGASLYEPQSVQPSRASSSTFSSRLATRT